MGPVAVLDRFRQIEPTLLFAADGYRFGGQAHDRRALGSELIAGLPTLRHVVDVPVLGLAPEAAPRGGVSRHAFATLCEGPECAEPEWLPFDHPLWIVYSSGTTGLPKPIVHGHGGIVLEGLKGGLHNNLGPTVDTGDRFFWYSSTGWIMWNCQVSGLLGGTTICLYDGSPASCEGTADWSPLWRFATLTRCTFFGAGAAFYASCGKAGVEPQRLGDLSALRAVGSTGSPLADDSYRWIWQQLPKVDGRDIWIACISGGTDFAGAFIGGLRTLPQTPGKMQCRMLGSAVEAWNEAGQGVIGEVGELVCTRPIPSMPLYFWNDPGNARYVSSYFDMYPGVWRHGDWLKIDADGTCVIYGRSDATINRHGLRMGTSEIYSAIEALPEVLDAMVVDLEYLGRPSWMPLFVVLRPGLVLDEALKARLNHAVRSALSPRFVPDAIHQVAEIPRTLSGKKQELPIKKLLLGQPIDKVLNREAMANPACLDWYVAFARDHARDHA
jgi:acetoacetyl-CoA synthetase